MAPECDTAEKAARVAAQWQQAKGDSPSVTCICKLTMPLRFAFRCLYCREFFCGDCAEMHFGQTRAEYEAAKRPNVRAKRTVEADAGWPRKENLHRRLERPAGGCRSGSAS